VGTGGGRGRGGDHGDVPLWTRVSTGLTPTRTQRGRAVWPLAFERKFDGTQVHHRTGL
jgi:hypothetical protein